jgi:hypothetical protein
MALLIYLNSHFTLITKALTPINPIPTQNSPHCVSAICQDLW